MNVKKNLWVVICGNIRDELDFKLTLTRILELRNLSKVQHIVFSTWKGEIDKYVELRNQLKALKIYIIENEPFTIEIQNTPSACVNYWRQARQLLSALDIIPKADFVLRVRTDRSLNFINHMDRRGIFESYQEKVTKIGGFPTLLNYKVIAFRPRTTRPFQMIDFILLGQNKDLYKLVNFDFYELNFQKDIVANTQWFAQPFIKEFPVLRDYMRLIRYTQAVKVFKKYVDRYKEDAVFPELIYKTLAVYFLVLYTHFKIIGTNDFDNASESNLNFYSVFSNTLSDNGFRYHNLGTMINNPKLIDLLIERGFRKSKAYDSFIKYVDRALINNIDDDIFEMSEFEYRQINEYFDKDLFEYGEPIRWLKKTRFSPLEKNRLYKYSSENDGNILNCLNVADKDWKDLSHTMVIENDLYDFWLKLKNNNIELTERLLLPIARTGHECAIYVLLDLLFNNLVDKKNIDEVLRIALFFLDIRIGNNSQTFNTVFNSLLLIKMYDENKLELNNIEKIINVVLTKIVNRDEADMILKVKKGEYTNKILMILNKIKDDKDSVNIELAISIMMNRAVDDNVRNKLQGTERIIADKKWIRNTMVDA